ncbi:unnamed protein product [Gordionus sp. m RMFG-2023]|uniref:mannose-1-phosphate guanyltransferase beta-like n=1 Tax=Gordionus sp. m RMFG-2023 TaxID=3053472 RepID=UPI0030E222A1
MKALILVGGYGTRLRPLTLTKPKSLIEFCNKPIVVHQIEALVDAGVNHIILAVCYQADQLEDELKIYEKKLGIKISISSEIKEPLGTAGAIAQAKKFLLPAPNCNKPFFVLNSDIICNFPFKEMIVFHENHGKEGTLVVTKVDEPSKYGVVVYSAEKGGEVERFTEKPKIFVSNKINAGLYILSPSFLSRIKPIKTSIEKDVFPYMADEGQLFALDLKGYWMDVGQPKDFLTGMCMYMDFIVKKQNKGINDVKNGIIAPVIIDETADIGNDCIIGPNVVIGKNCRIEEGVRLKNTILMPGAKIGQHSWLDHCIIGWNSDIGKWVRIENVSVLGENVEIKDEIYVNGGKILPHKAISTSIREPQIVL